MPVLSSPGETAARTAAKRAARTAEAAPVRPSAPPPERPPAKTASVEIDPDRVLGLDRQEVKALLGEPGFVRRDNPMELWRYHHEGCAVALFFYTEKASGKDDFRVRHIEAWAPGAEEISPRACLSALARRSRQGPAG